MADVASTHLLRGLQPFPIISEDDLSRGQQTKGVETAQTSRLMVQLFWSYLNKFSKHLLLTPVIDEGCRENVNTLFGKIPCSILRSKGIQQTVLTYLKSKGGEWAENKMEIVLIVPQD